MKVLRVSLVFFLFTGVFSFTLKKTVSVKQVSLDFTSKILEKGKYITVSGEMYYHVEGKRLTTHLVKPFESVTIANANGELKIYDVKDNTIMYSTSAANSSETSYFHHFFNSSTSDMGLQKLGYAIFDTKIEEGMLVTSWAPKQAGTGIKRIVLAHKQSAIMFMEIISQNEKPLGKIFFSQYSKIGSYAIPLSITEFAYTGKGDSTITRKTYSNAKVNEQVNSKYADFTIPKDAKVVKIKK